MTTNATHAGNILDYIERQGDPKFEGRFAVITETAFGANWRVPKTVLDQLLTESWATTTLPKYIAQP